MKGKPKMLAGGLQQKKELENIEKYSKVNHKNKKIA